VDGDDLSVWETQYGTASPPLAVALTSPSQQVTAGSLVSQSSDLTAQPLSAELVDAAIAWEFSPKSRADARSALVTFREEHTDWSLAAARWAEPLTWHGASVFANRLDRRLADDSGIYPSTDDDAVYEELLDELFADDELISLL